MASVTIYNGLSQPASIKFGAVNVSVAPASSTQIEVAPNTHYAVETRAKDGRVIETFDADVSAALTTHSAFVADEVLAVALTTDASAVTVADLNGRAVRYSLVKA